VLALKLGGALAPYLKTGLKFGAIFLAVDDLLAFLQGKDSVIGDLIEAAFGEGSSETVRLWVNDAIFEFKRFLSSADDTYTTLENRNASYTDLTLALFASMWREIISGGAGFRASAVEIWQGVNLDFQNMVLSLSEAWNSFVGMLHLPDTITAALKIDTAPIKVRVQERTEAKNEAGWKRYSVEHPEQFAKMQAEGKAPKLAGADAPKLPGARPILGGVTPAGEALPANSQTLLEAAHGRPEVQASYGPYRPEAVTSTFNMTQDARVTINLPAGTSESTARRIGREVGEANRAATLQAKQALTQRGSK
jgi:hypothetical protein